MLFSKKNLVNHHLSLFKEKKENDFTREIGVYAILFILFLSFHIPLSAAEYWQSYWHEGIELQAVQKYGEASTQFEIALNMMSNEEKNLFPFVMVSKIENDFILQNYLLVLEETQSILDSADLTDYERLICGVRRIGAFIKMGNDNAALQEYKKYVVGCPLLPTYHQTENKIIIRNMIDSDCFKTFIKQSMLTHFCENEKDIYDHGNLWIINITKSLAKDEDNSLFTSKTARTKIVDGRYGQADMQRRTEEQIEACCNGCDIMSAAATTICACLAIPEALTGPLAPVCVLSCVVFVERLNIDCKAICKRQPGEYPRTFEEWKTQFNKQYPGCPSPSCT